MIHEVIQSDYTPDDWLVEAIDCEGDGQVFVARFIGPLAEQRAREYAAWKSAQPSSTPIKHSSEMKSCPS